TETPNLPGTNQTPGPRPVPPPETNNPKYPGNRPPILTGTPTRAPIPPIIIGRTPPISTMPGPSGSSTTHGYGTTSGVYADIGANVDYASCEWFKNNYDRTGNIYWLRRYRVCLWQY